MSTCVRDVTESDWQAVGEIFNHFVRHSPAAYPEEPVPVEMFRERHHQQSGYPFLVAQEGDEDGDGGQIVGFAYLSPFNPAPTMRRAAVLTYFIRPDRTGRGLGGRFLAELLGRGRALGVHTFLAHVSSLNEGSLRFHRTHGFTECGRFVGVGEKHGQRFDVVWFQRTEA